jgi:type IV secretory pathway TrbF-like protein
MDHLLAADLPTKTPESAARQWARAWGDPRVLNTYLKVTLWGAGVAILALVGLNYRTQIQLAAVKPLVIRIDTVGRATAVSYDVATTYQPQEYEVRYMLKEWVLKHFSRFHSTVRRDFAESLYFLSPELSAAAMTKTKPGGEVDTFLKGTAAEEVEVDVKNVALSNISKPPYEARIDFDKVTYGMGTRTPRTRETYVAQVSFTILGHPPAVSFEPINPLGFIITQFQTFQAFQADRQERH